MPLSKSESEARQREGLIHATTYGNILLSSETMQRQQPCTIQHVDHRSQSGPWAFTTATNPPSGIRLHHGHGKPYLNCYQECNLLLLSSTPQRNCSTEVCHECQRQVIFKRFQQKCPSSLGAYFDVSDHNLITTSLGT